MIKPKILSDEAILEIAHFAIEYPDRDMPQAEQSKQRRRAVAQAQNDYCYKEMMKQFVEWIKNNATDAIAVKDSDTTQQMIIRAIPEDKFKALQSQLGEG